MERSSARAQLCGYVSDYYQVNLIWGFLNQFICQDSKFFYFKWKLLWTSLTLNTETILIQCSLMSGSVSMVVCGAVWPGTHAADRWQSLLIINNFDNNLLTILLFICRAAVGRGGGRPQVHWALVTNIQSLSMIFQPSRNIIFLAVLLCSRW